MRTSRPMKRPPRPLLSTQQEKPSKSDSKGKGKASSQDPSQRTDGAVYSYATSKKGKGVGRAQQRLKGAREDVSESFNAGPSSFKGKRKANADSDSEDDENLDGDDDGGIYGADDFSKYKDIKFKVGMDSDDEAGANGGQFDEDDEEIDSDMADSDEEDSDDGKSRKKAKKSKRNNVANDFREESEEEGIDIDLNEDSNADDDEASEDGYMDLSEVLARQVAKEKAAEAKAKGIQPKSKASTSKGSKLPAVIEAEEQEDFTSFKPGAFATEDDEELDGSDDDEEDEDDDDEDDEDDEDDSDEAEDSDGDSLDEDEDDEAALDKLGSIVSSLNRDNKRAAGDSEGEAEEVDERELQRKRRRLLLARERNEAGPEGEFNTGRASGKLTIDSLLSSLGAEQASALKQSLKPLIASAKHGQTTIDDANNAIEAELSRLTADEKALLARTRQKVSSNPLKAPGALPAPLAPLHQAKIQRQAAKEKQDETIKEWDETVKYMKGINRDGEDDPQNRLDLKALNDSQGKGKGVTSAALVAKFSPANDMERQMNALIASTGSGQRELLATESTALMDALPTKSTEAAEALDKARIAQLRLARELMFRAERKAKRVAKIKSRTFRKIAKKSRQRQALKDGDGALTLDEMVELDAMDGGSRAEEERERLETMRARERATLRHASGASGATAGGRWSKGLKGLDGMDDDMKEAIRTRESRQDLLRKKVLGQDSGEDSDASDESDDDTEAGAEEDLEDLKARALEEMEDIQSGSGQSPALSKGVMSMKFMQRASKKNEERVDGMIEDFRMQVEGKSDDEDDVTERYAAKGGDRVAENPGRMVFGPSGSKASQAQSAQDGQTLSQRAKRRLNRSKTDGNVSVNGSSSSQAPRSPGLHSAASTATLLDYNPFATLTTSDRIVNGRPEPSQEANPWLNPSAEDSRVRLSSKKNNQTVTKESASTDKSASRLLKTQGRSKEAVKKAQADASVDIDVEHVLSNTSLAAPAASINVPASSPGPPTSPAEKAQRQNREMAPPPSSAKKASNEAPAESSDDSDDDEDALPEAVVKAQGPNAFKQRDLVARAFAGDNVVTDFVEMKRAEIERDAPKEEDLTLPGWGAWGGKGARKTQKQQSKKHVKQIAGIDAADRKDAKYDHVIISEKKDKKAAKYMTKDLPYPYTSVKQFEQKLAQPTGIEWNTRGTVKEMTTPRVLTKPGMVIKPVTRKM